MSGDETKAHKKVVAERPLRYVTHKETACAQANGTRGGPVGALTLKSAKRHQRVAHRISAKEPLGVDGRTGNDKRRQYEGCINEIEVR